MSDDPALIDPDGHFPYARDRADQALAQIEAVNDKIAELRARAQRAREAGKVDQADHLEDEADELRWNAPVTTLEQVDACERIVTAEAALRADPDNPQLREEYETAVRSAQEAKAHRGPMRIGGGAFRTGG